MVVTSTLVSWKRANNDLMRRSTALQRSNEELDQFAFIASHDLQEPLRIVVSYLQLLERKHGPNLDPEATQILERAVNAATRMHRLINDLLDYSRVGTSQERALGVDSARILNSVVEDLQPALRRHAVTLTYDPLPQVAMLESELERIPVIALSTSCDNEDVDLAYDLHANAYVAKPLNLNELLAVMRTLDN